MRLLYRTDNGEVLYAVYDKDWFQFQETTTVPLTEFVIDEVNPINKERCLDLWQTQTRVNSALQTKYYVSALQLFQREDWTPRRI